MPCGRVVRPMVKKAHFVLCPPSFAHLSASLQGFCVVAAIAVFIDYLLQLTWFLAALTLDARRARSRRPDVFCCVQLDEVC